jgi:hypothetical protein
MIMVMVAEIMARVPGGEVVIHVEEGVTARDHNGGDGEAPFELFELGGEGIGEDEVVVDELTIQAAGPITDAR